jgi:hypothetical protein
MIAVDSYLIFSKSSWVSRLTDSKIFVVYCCFSFHCYKPISVLYDQILVCNFSSFSQWSIVCGIWICCSFANEIGSKCFKFIWNGKPDKVNRNTLIGDFEKDGLKMIAVDSYLIFSKSSWVSRLTDSKIFELETDTTQMFKCLYVAYGYVVALQIVLSPVLEHNDKQICGTIIIVFIRKQHILSSNYVMQMLILKISHFPKYI